MTYDFAIIGGGFFGSAIAVHLGRLGFKVALIEAEKKLLTRASFNNQARIHNGYHYPRSFLTAARSHANYHRFLVDYAPAVDQTFKKYYAVGRLLSKVTPSQFSRFCQRLNLPCPPAPDAIVELFNPRLVEAVFNSEESAFDADKLSELLLESLVTLPVTLILGTQVTHLKPTKAGITLRLTPNQTIKARQVYNVTYSGINKINLASGLPLIPLKHELTEMVLIKPPKELQGLGLTLMCGPFFSIMPFPARRLYSLSHVRYTPHFAWHEPGASYQPPKNLSQIKASHARQMLADASRYLPCLTKVKVVESLWEIKTVLPRSELSDSRPILFKPNHGLSGYTCIMGAKLDNIYDVLQEIDHQLQTN